MEIESIKFPLEVNANSDFSIHNIPFGVISLNSNEKTLICATRYGI